MFEVKNAQITDTFLGYNENGFATFFIHVVWNKSFSCDLGGMPMDQEALANVCGILKTVGVRNWEELNGKLVRIAVEETTTEATKDAEGKKEIRVANRIGNILNENDWFDFQIFLPPKDKKEDNGDADVDAAEPDKDKAEPDKDTAESNE